MFYYYYYYHVYGCYLTVDGIYIVVKWRCIKFLQKRGKKGGSSGRVSEWSNMRKMCSQPGRDPANGKSNDRKNIPKGG